MLTRFAPSLQTLDGRDVPAVITVNALADGSNQVVVTGDATNETVLIRDFGNGVVHTAATGAGFVATGNVTSILVLAGDGSDTVRYDLLGSLQPGRSQDVRVFLDDSDYSTTPPGNDQFEAKLWPGVAITERARLQVSTYGGRGNDTLNFIADDVDVRAGGWMKTNYSGGDGNDVIIQRYRGEMDGSLGMRSWGDGGTDTIRQSMTFDFGSTGRVGALVYGGADSDTTGLFVTMQPGMTVDKLELHGDDDGGVADSLNWSGPVTVFI